MKIIQLKNEGFRPMSRKLKPDFERFRALIDILNRKNLPENSVLSINQKIRKVNHSFQLMSLPRILKKVMEA